MKWLVVLPFVFGAGSALSGSFYTGKGMWYRSNAVGDKGHLKMYHKSLEGGGFTLTVDFGDRKETVSVASSSYTGANGQSTGKLFNPNGEEIGKVFCAGIFRIDTCQYEFTDGERQIILKETCYECSSFNIKEKAKFISTSIKSNTGIVHWEGKLAFDMGGLIRKLREKFPDSFE